MFSKFSSNDSSSEHDVTSQEQQFYFWHSVLSIYSLLFINIPELFSIWISGISWPVLVFRLSAWLLLARDTWLVKQLSNGLSTR